MRPSFLLDDGRSNSFLKSQLIIRSLVPFPQQDAVAPLQATLLPGSLHSALARHSWEGSRDSLRKLFCALQARLCSSCGRSSAQDLLLPRRAPWYTRMVAHLPLLTSPLHGARAKLFIPRATAWRSSISGDAFPLPPTCYECLLSPQCY